MTTRSLSCTCAGVPPTGALAAQEERALTTEGGAPWGVAGAPALVAMATEEDFPVASRLLPRRVRAELLALYGYARLVDEIGDSYPGDRLAALDWVESELRAALEGHRAAHPLVEGAARLARAGKVPAAPMFDLVEANRMDQEVHSYATFDELLGYCALSANAVGRMVLALFGASTAERVAWSDSICTGLQLVEHWHDVGEDARAGRVYLPTEDLDSFGVDGEELLRPPPASARLRALIAFETWRARRFLDSGASLAASGPVWLRLAVAGFWAGGHAALDALAEAGFDPLGRAPRPRRVAFSRHFLEALTGRHPWT